MCGGVFLMCPWGEMLFMSTYSSTILFSLHWVFEQMCCMSFHKSLAKVQNIQIYAHIHAGDARPVWCLSAFIFSSVCARSPSCVQLCNLWTVACQAPLSMELFQQEYWGVAISSFRRSSGPWDLTHLLCLLHCSRFLTTETSGKLQLFATIGNLSILGFNYYL